MTWLRSLTARLLVGLVVPLAIASVGVGWITASSLEGNAVALAEAMQIEAAAQRALALALIQEDASKAILIDRAKLSTYSKAKLAAYDGHKELLTQVQGATTDPEVLAMLAELEDIDAGTLRPLDTRLLEQLFVDLDGARRLYFTEYEPARGRYQATIEALTEHTREQVVAATAATAQNNARSLAKVGGVLGLALVVVTGIIVVLGRQVDQRDREMRALLAGIDVGMAYFDRSGHLSDQRSQALAALLPGSDAHHTLADLLAAVAGSDPEDVAFTLQTLWPDEEEDEAFFSPFEATISFLPQTVDVDIGDGLRHLALRYGAHYDAAGQLDRVYMTVDDVTETMQRAAELEAAAERVRRISLAAEDVEAFTAFAEEVDQLAQTIDGCLQGSEEGTELKRYLHTMKGNVSIFGFQILADRLHGVEDLLADGADGPVVAQAWDQARRGWLEQRDDLRQVLKLGEDRRSIRVDRDRLHALGLAAQAHPDDVLPRYVSLFRIPAVTLFARYHRFVTQLASRRGLEGVGLVVDEGSADLTRGEFAALDTALVHLMRNAVDHAATPAHEREANDKPPNMTLQVRTQRRASTVVLRIEDDGRGVDREALAAKAVQSGRWTEEQARAASDEDKLQLIFAPALSSATEVTQTSGRGMGMDLVRAHVEAQGGSIEVSSTLGVGTTFVVRIAASTPGPVGQPAQGPQPVA